ncbi:MAG: cytochrome d ubiquinol oxidase subunit II [Halodesulfurarchaeum sp.]
MALQTGPVWFGVPLVELWFVALFLTLAMFLWLDGTNFGMGVLYGLSDGEETRDRILAAIAPLWDGAEVWLVVFGGSLFAVFPDVYGGLFSGNYLLMFAILGSLIIRGVSPEFMEQRDDERWRRIWSRTFVLGSTLAPFFLGMFAANWLVGATGIITLPGIVVGLALLALSTAQGTGFLGMKTASGLEASTTRYGLRSQVAYLVLALLAVLYLFVAVEGMAAKIARPVPIALVALTAVLGVAYLWLLRAGRYRPAFLAAGTQIFGLVALVAVLLFPTIYPVAGLTVYEAAVSTLQLKMMTGVLAVFLPLVLFYFAVLYSAFSGPVEAGEGY